MYPSLAIFTYLSTSRVISRCLNFPAFNPLAFGHDTLVYILYIYILSLGIHRERFLYLPVFRTNTHTCSIISDSRTQEYINLVPPDLGPRDQAIRATCAKRSRRLHHDFACMSTTSQGAPQGVPFSLLVEYLLLPTVCLFWWGIRDNGRRGEGERDFDCARDTARSRRALRGLS